MNDAFPSCKSLAFQWTPEIKEAVFGFWRDGWSAREIIAKLNLPISRNAVIGVVHRAGLARDGGAVANRSAARRPPSKPTIGPRAKPVAVPTATVAAPARRLPTAPDPIAANYVSIQDDKGKRLLDLAAGDCRFPVGKATGADQSFCAALRPDGGIYCAQHALKAFNGRPAHEERHHKRLANL